MSAPVVEIAAVSTPRKGKLDMPHMMTLRKCFVSLVAFVLVGMFTGAAKADSFLLVGNSNPNATAILNITSLSSTTLVFSLSNNSSVALGGVITGIGFDIGSSHGPFAEVSKVGGFGTYVFCNSGCGNVPQFSGAVLDFAELTHAGNFAGGNPPSGTSQGKSTPVFTISGNFTGLTQQQIADAIYVRFQAINSEPDSDVAHGGRLI